MRINEIEAWAHEYKKTHTFTELISEAIRLNKGNTEDLTELQLETSKNWKFAGFSATGTFDIIMQKRCRDKIVNQIKDYTGELPTGLDLQEEELYDFYVIIVDKLCEGKSCPYNRETLLDPGTYHYSGKAELLFFLAGVTLSSELKASDQSSILLALADRLLYDSGFVFTVNADAYISQCPKMKCRNTYIMDGKNFFSGKTVTV